MFEAVELLGSCLPVTPVYRVLCADASRARIVEAHDQLIGIGVTDLGRDLVELATLHHREIDVEVDPGKWVRVRPDGSMAPASRPGSLDCIAKIKRRRARRNRRAERRAALKAWWSIKAHRWARPGRPALLDRNRRPGRRASAEGAAGTITARKGRTGQRRRVGRVSAASTARTI